jgi:hypothetical protein
MVQHAFAARRLGSDLGEPNHRFRRASWQKKGRTPLNS